MWGVPWSQRFQDFQFISYPQKSARLQKKTSEALEAYLIFESDQPKDAANEISLLARTLDHACDVYAETGQSLPPNLIFEAGCIEIVAASDYCVLPCFFPWLRQTDNTCREAKNQFLTLFHSFLVAGKKWLAFMASEGASLVCGLFLMVFSTIISCSKVPLGDAYVWPAGHTHGPLDQRFSILCTALAAAPVLQCPKA